MLNPLVYVMITQADARQTHRAHRPGAVAECHGREVIQACPG
jgi:hypothetical protein